MPKPLDYSDLDPAQWREYPEIETDSLWLIGSRERGNGHQLDYHGNYVPQIATQTFTRYTKRGEVVLDLFLGSGTSAIEALRLGRRCLGVELKQDLVSYVATKIPPDRIGRDVVLLQGDSSAPELTSKIQPAFAALGVERAQLLVLHPPYHDIIRFSDSPGDLSNAASTGQFLDLFERVARNGFELLQPGRFAVLVIGDKYTGGELVPLGFHCLERMNRAGFVTRALVVKNIEGNEVGKGRTNNLWRYRALAGGFYIFKHEYVIIFQKPAARRPASRGHHREFPEAH
ncbi:MAG: DNA methylase [Chloroflexi bacterium]|nr:DNA methylase [Chloroflexota bacterium]